VAYWSLSLMFSGVGLKVVGPGSSGVGSGVGGGVGGGAEVDAGAGEGAGAGTGAMAPG